MPSLLQLVGQLVDQSITALRGGDKTQAAELLAQALQKDPNHEQAWLWLSGIVTSDAERRFCLERVRAINPQNAAAQHGLSLLEKVTPRAPSFAQADNKACTFPGCNEPVNRAGHTFCYQHWKAINRPPAQSPPAQPPAQQVAPQKSASAAKPTGTPSPQPPAPSLVSASVIGERLGIHQHSVNPMLVELGWMSKDAKGWKVTPQGAGLGAVQKFHTQNGGAFVLWPEAILTNAALLATIRSLKGEAQESEIKAASGDRSFRDKFPAKHRTTDGHLVRSKAEVLIDNWLYTAGIVHAYERRLPIEEEAYCDFYVPAGRVYIEYWGFENDVKYRARQEVKRGLYQKYGLHLIELSDDHIKNLDDELPKLLLKFGVVVS
jgi:hypothetical protein